MHRFNKISIAFIVLLISGFLPVTGIFAQSSISVTEGDTFHVNIDVTVESGGMNGLGFELLYDPAVFNYTGYKDCPFDIKACELLNHTQEGCLVVGLSQVSGECFSGNFSAITVGFRALPVTGDVETEFVFRNGQATLDGENIVSVFENGICRVFQLNRIRVRILKR